MCFISPLHFILRSAKLTRSVAIAGYFINYVKDTWPGTPDATSAKYLAGAQGAFAVGRFLGSGIMKFVRARWVFLVYLSCTVAFLAASVTQTRQVGVVMLFMTLFFESVCFPTIMALGIRGLGRHYKRGSGFIVGGVCGGAVVPPILGHVADMRDNTGFAFIVPTMVCSTWIEFIFLPFFIPYLLSFLLGPRLILVAVYGRRLDLRYCCELRSGVHEHRG